MNNPIIIAVIATIVTAVAFRLAGRISSGFYRGSAQLGSVLAALAVASMMTDSPEIGAEVGQYYFIGIVACVGLEKLLGRSGKKP